MNIITLLREKHKIIKEELQPVRGKTGRIEHRRDRRSSILQRERKKPGYRGAQDGRDPKKSAQPCVCMILSDRVLYWGGIYP